MTADAVSDGAVSEARKYSWGTRKYSWGTLLATVTWYRAKHFLCGSGDAFYAISYIIRLYNKCWGEPKEPTKNNLKKVEHIWKKSVKMELTRNQNGGQPICSIIILPKNYSDCKM